MTDWPTASEITAASRGTGGQGRSPSIQRRTQVAPGAKIVSSA
ncbi:hypothetical protein ACWERY_10975 [Streptomyces sp. NPDC004082]